MKGIPTEVNLQPGLSFNKAVEMTSMSIKPLIRYYEFHVIQVQLNNCPNVADRPIAV